MTLPKEKFHFILIATLNRDDDMHIYSCLRSSLNVVFSYPDFGLVYPVDDINTKQW